MEQINKTIRLGVVDDDLLLLQLMTDFFRNSGAFEICLTATSGNKCLEMIRSQEILPEILVTDLRMSDGNGLDMLEAIQKEALPVKTIVLSNFYRPSFIGQMMKMNVSAFLPKEIDRDDLRKVIQTVAEKGYYLSEDQVDLLRSQVSSKSPKIQLSAKDALSPRETEVLRLLCQQHTTHGIAERLFLSDKTVESHKSSLMLKTGAKNMAGLVIYAIQNRIVNADEIILDE